MSKHDHYKYGVGMCEGLFKDEEDCIPIINKRQFALGIISVCVKQMRPTRIKQYISQWHNWFFWFVISWAIVMIILNR